MESILEWTSRVDHPRPANLSPSCMYSDSLALCIRITGLPGLPLRRRCGFFTGITVRNVRNVTIRTSYSVGIKKPRKISPPGLDRQRGETVVLSCDFKDVGRSYLDLRLKAIPRLWSPVRRAVSECRGNILPAPKCLGKSMLCLPLTTWWVATAKPVWTCASRAWSNPPESSSRVMLRCMAH
jgi:hypothetical protein